MPVPRALRAFRHRDFRLFWSAQLVSLCGTWMQSLAQAWLVLELTGSAMRLGIVSALQFGPFLVLALVAGAVVDRVPRRRLLLGTQAALLVQASVLAALAWSGHVRYWHVAVLALWTGLANTLDMPTRQSFVGDMVGKDDLVNAVAMNSAAFNAARIVGPAIAGVLIARYGVTMAFVLNAASFVAPLVALAAIRTDGAALPGPRRSLREELLEAAAYAAQNSRIVLVLALLLIVSLFIFNYNVIVPLYARDVLDAGANGLGILMAALGVGALAGAVVLALGMRARPPVWVIVVSAMTLAIGALVLAVVHEFRLAVIALFAMGVGGIIFTAGCNATLQLTAPDALRGRVMGLYSWVFVGVAPVGAFLMGWIAEHAGVAASLAVGGGASVVGVAAIMLGWWYRRR
jgi:MFS family permease